MTATHELVVPRSMPITLAIPLSSLFRETARPRSGPALNGAGLGQIWPHPHRPVPDELFQIPADSILKKTPSKESPQGWPVYKRGLGGAQGGRGPLANRTRLGAPEFRRRPLAWPM
jgi:hypothetical protein